MDFSSSGFCHETHPPIFSSFSQRSFSRYIGDPFGFVQSNRNGAPFIGKGAVKAKARGKLGEGKTSATSASAAAAAAAAATAEVDCEKSGTMEFRAPHPLLHPSHAAGHPYYYPGTLARTS
ncbi:mucin-6-like [Vespula squamosa]|uniref:Mucin-6-like n=1 Tax=Vespula squamosa TaxID=30214 RepID=A0ABD2AUA9_VESSQ